MCGLRWVSDPSMMGVGIRYQICVISDGDFGSQYDGCRNSLSDMCGSDGFRS